MQPYPFEQTPETEISSRIQNLQQAMVSQGLHAILMTHKPDLFYFSGTAQDAWLYVQADQEPVLFVRRYLPRAIQESAIRRIEPLDSIKTLPDRIASCFTGLPRNLGIAFDVVPVRDYLYFRKLFKDVDICDATFAIEACRQVKSDYEIEKMDQSARVSKKTFDYMAAHIRPGISEMEFCGLFETFARGLGHSGKLLTRHYRLEGFPHHLMSGASGGIPGALDSPVCGTGTSNAYPYGAGPKLLRENEPILIDFGTVIDGYHIDESRMFAMGKMQEKAASASLGAIDILHAVRERMKPGVSLGEVFDTAVAASGKTGFKDQFLGMPELKSRFVGHGVGLELVETPIISKGSPVVLKPGMVFAVEPKFIFQGEFAAGIETMIQVTESGSRFLSRTENRIFYC